MKCPKCQTIVLAEDVNIQALVAKCRQCHEVFRVTEVLRAQLPSQADEIVPRFPKPGTLTLVEEDDLRVIRRRWFRPVYVFLLFFCIAWDSFLVFWYAMAIGMPGQGGFQVIAILFPVLHVAVGVSLTYVTIAGFFNKSYLGVTSDGLYVRHRPLPWFGSRNLTAGEVKEVYVEHGMTQRSGGSAQQMFTLSAVVGDGRRLTLLGSLDLPEAQFCAQKVGEWLSLPPSQLGTRWS